MSTLTTGAEDDRGDTSSRKQGRIHPAQASNEFGLPPQSHGCLIVYRPNNGCIFGNLERIPYHVCFQGCLERGINCCNLIEYVLYLRLNYLLSFCGDGAPFYAQETACRIAGE